MKGAAICVAAFGAAGLMVVQPVLACCGGGGGGGRDRTSVFENMRNIPLGNRRPNRVESFVGSYLAYGPPPTRRPPPPPRRPAMSDAVRTLLVDIQVANSLIKRSQAALAVLDSMPLSAGPPRRTRRELRNILKLQIRATKQAMQEMITRSLLTGERVNWH